ncbi:diguanylate cyclase [Metabacillus iocasae]|uniref:Diguanylate cyclase (GGDEF)-like protein n=1 Tax=Priestia iocasae TaxID=2291674 RepID=A0ABS2QRQ1_9BACI|nr:diguanylate cyclase (GGDEF)-like protein [Metabacillus iocasae]
MNELNKRNLEYLQAYFFKVLSLDENTSSLQYMMNKIVKFLVKEYSLQSVSFIIWDEFTNRYTVESTTNEIERESVSHLVFEAFSFLRQQNQQSFTVEGNDVSICLRTDEKKYYLHIVQSEESQIDAEFWEQLSTECGKMLELLLTYKRAVSQEMKYEQLYQITTKFHLSLEMEDILEETVYTLQKVYPDFTYLLLLSYDNKNDRKLPIEYLQYDNKNISEKAMEAYVCGEVEVEYDLVNQSAILYAPLKGKQGNYGVLQVVTEDKELFSKDIVKFITVLAHTAGSALEKAQLYAQSRRLIDDLRLINETSHQLNSNLRLTDTICYMSHQIRESFHAQEVGFVLFSEHSDKYQLLKGSTLFFSESSAHFYIEYVYNRLQEEKEAIFVNESPFSFSNEEMYYHSIIAVPMVQNGVVKGAAIVLHSDPYSFTFDTFKLLQSLIHHSTLAFTNSMLREELEKLVVTDHLTGLYARNYLDDKVEKSMIQDPCGTFLLIDIDDFKKVNDTYGHQIGDQIIIQIANIIIQNIRVKDVGARWGGEELAVYLPSVPIELGVTIAERLVKKVEAETKPSATISCGVSCWSRDKVDTLEELVLRADQALYCAKDLGKNRVVVEREKENTSYSEK